ANTDGVTQRNLIATESVQHARNLRHALGVYFTLVRTTADARHVASYLDAPFASQCDDWRKALDRFSDRAIDVLLRERLGSRTKNRHLARTAVVSLQKPLEIRR